MTEKLRINLELKGDLMERFKAVKEHMGFKRNKAVFCVLISEKYHAIQKLKTRKLFVDPKIYDELKVYADAKGLTVEGYVEKLVMENDLSEL